MTNNEFRQGQFMKQEHQLYTTRMQVCAYCVARVASFIYYNDILKYYKMYPLWLPEMSFVTFVTGSIRAV